MVQTYNLCIVNSWLLDCATLSDCSISLAELKLEAARTLIKLESDDKYVPPVHGAKVHSARNVNRIFL